MAQKKNQSRGSKAAVKNQMAKDRLPTGPKEQLALENIYGLLLKTSQVDFSRYRDTTVLRRLNRRMHLCKQDNYTAYFKFLKKNPAETDQLYYDLLLSYTQFFRDPYIFETLKKDVFPALVKNRSARRPIRIWVPGCSNGKEVYSIAICLHEFMEDNNTKIPVKIFGTDLVEQHIITARTGIYNDKIREEVTPERLESFFDKTPEGLKVTKHIRELCVFATQDITQDPPFPNMDFISCRNVLIYFDQSYQDAAIPRFHFSLNPDGFLLLGSSETMSRFPELFTVLDKKSNLYSKRLPVDQVKYHFPFTQRTQKLKTPSLSAPPSLAAGAGKSTDSEQINDILAATYAPPCALVDSNLQILKFIGDPYPYLAPESGDASLKLQRMADSALMPDIYVALEQAKKENDKVRKKNIVFQNDGREIYLDICVIPVELRNGNRPGFLILFEKSVAPLAEITTPSKKSAKERSEVERLKQELQQAKEHLRQIIEEKDGVNQELWAANEEIMSTNEELQSVNEEMEASKEELESGNEELLALNEELQTKNLALAESEENLKKSEARLVEAQRIAGMGDFTWEVETGKVTWSEGMHTLLGYDKSEEIDYAKVNAEIHHPDDLERITDWLKECLESGKKHHAPNEYRLIRKDGSILHVQTNVTVSYKDGKPIKMIGTCIDITERKRAEQALRQSEEKHRTLFETMIQGVVYQSADGRIISANKAAERILGLTLDQIQGRTSVDPQWKSIHEDGSDFPGNTHPSMTALKTGKVVSNVVMGVFNPKIETHTWININAVPQFKPGEKTPYQVYTTFEDITESKQAEKKLKESEEKFRSLIETSSDVIWEMNLDAKFTYISPMVKDVWGYEQDEVIGKSLFDFVVADGLEDLKNKFQTEVKLAKPFSLYENKYLHKNGHHIIIETSGTPIFDDKGKLQGYRGVNRDITERKQAEEQREQMAKEWRTTFDNVNSAIWLLNSDHRILRSNRKAEEFFDLESEAMHGRYCWEIMHGASEPIPECPVQQVRKSLKREQMDLQIGERTFEITIDPILDENGKIISMVHIVNDITERKRAEETLKSKLDEVERFNKTMVGRELKMIELKKEVNQLCSQLKVAEKYRIAGSSKQNK